MQCLAICYNSAISASFQQRLQICLPTEWRWWSGWTGGWGRCGGGLKRLERLRSVQFSSFITVLVEQEKRTNLGLGPHSQLRIVVSLKNRMCRGPQWSWRRWTESWCSMTMWTSCAYLTGYHLTPVSSQACQGTCWPRPWRLLLSNALPLSFARQHHNLLCTLWTGQEPWHVQITRADIMLYVYITVQHSPHQAGSPVCWVEGWVGILPWLSLLGWYLIPGFLMMPLRGCGVGWVGVREENICDRKWDCQEG